MNQERRKDKRSKKHFLLKYYEQGKKDQIRSTTQLKNISGGGLCFVTEEDLPKGTVLWIELKTPYLTDTVYLEGEVVSTDVKVKNMLYETHFRFENLTEEAQIVLRKLMEYFEHEKGSHE